MEILIIVLALVTLGVAAQSYGADSRPVDPERDVRRWALRS
jgi:hypothetical protein